MRKKRKKESSKDNTNLIPKQISSEYDHPQFKINKKKLRERLTTIKTYSVGLTEKVMISRIVFFLDKKLPLSHDEIIKYLIYCLKIYNEMNSVPLQKFALLPQDERPKAIENFKSVFIIRFSEIIESKEGTPVDYLLFVFEDYFKMYD